MPVFAALVAARVLTASRCLRKRSRPCTRTLATGEPSIQQSHYMPFYPTLHLQLAASRPQLARAAPVGVRSRRHRCRQPRVAAAAGSFLLPAVLARARVRQCFITAAARTLAATRYPPAQLPSLASRDAHRGR